MAADTRTLRRLSHGQLLDRLRAYQLRIRRAEEGLDAVYREMVRRAELVDRETEEMERALASQPEPSAKASPEESFFLGGITPEV